MKHLSKAVDVVVKAVAPLIGAWIETMPCADTLGVFAVAPLIGAWIETAKHPAISVKIRVAPLIGAWIETYLLVVVERSHLSPLS